MIYYDSVLKENNFPAVLVESLHILFVRSLLNYRMYRDADKSLARPTSRCVLFDDENISIDASLVI